MITKLTVDMLTQDSVSIKTQQYAIVGGIEYAIGDPHRRAYVNNDSGRLQVQSEVQEPQKTAIFSVWGSEPTVTDVAQ